MYLQAALEKLYKAGATFREILPIMQEVRESMPRVNEIWENSSAAVSPPGRDRLLQEVLDAEQMVIGYLASGRYTLDDGVWWNAPQPCII